jgi:hypothetical protein
MKITVSLFITLISLCSAKAQIFEGKATYKNEYTSKVKSISSEQFSAMMGNTQEYFLKDGNYKSVTNGTFFQWQIYIHKENKLYSKLSNMNKLLWNDGAVNSDQVIKAEVNKNALEVMGQMCDELILFCTSGVQKYYFNNTLSINWKLFEQHKYGNWNEVVSRTKALPLKSIIENQQFILINTIAEITPMKIDDTIFQLPAGISIAKNPYQ